MSEILSNTEFVVPIFKADGDPYLEADGEAILVYAKRLTVAIAGDFPYTHWAVDTDNVTGFGLYGGTIATAKFTPQGNGIWTKEMDTSLLFIDHPTREDNYFVFIGDEDVPFTTDDWTLVKGYDPRYFGTLNFPPALISHLISNVFIDDGGVTKVAEAYIEAALIAKIDANTTHSTGTGEDHSSVLSLVNNYDMDTILAAIATDEDILNALANKLYSSSYLAERIASLT